MEKRYFWAFNIWVFTYFWNVEMLKFLIFMNISMPTTKISCFQHFNNLYFWDGWNVEGCVKCTFQRNSTLLKIQNVENIKNFNFCHFHFNNISHNFVLKDMCVTQISAFKYENLPYDEMLKITDTLNLRGNPLNRFHLHVL